MKLINISLLIRVAILWIEKNSEVELLIVEQYPESLYYLII